jgi:hypothetical protein
MRYFRSFPPLMRVVSILGILFFVAAVVLFLSLALNWSPFFVLPLAEYGRLGYIALNLFSLGGACFVVVGHFIVRQRQPSRRRRIPLDSWQSQAMVVALMLIAPLGGLIVTLASAPRFVFTGNFLVIFFATTYWPFIVGWLLVLH